jgi:L-asparaginase
MPSKIFKLVIIGTGGTLAGTASHANDPLGYTAAQLGVVQLVAGMPELADLPLEVQQLVQIDSKDMGWAVWLALATQLSQLLARADVGGVVVTHGTDTVEETAYFLQRILAPTKPVVLVAAMRPANSLQADGPQNLLDAVAVARSPQASGVVVVMAGCVHSALDVRKHHTYRIDAMSSGDAGVTARIAAGRLQVHRAWPSGSALGLACLPCDVTQWPWVELVTSCAGSTGVVVQALCDLGVRGLVVAATGNGTLHTVLEASLLQAQAAGVAVLRSTRCADGVVMDAEANTQAPKPTLPSAGALTAVQARIELMLRLMVADQTGTPLLGAT